MSRLPCNRSFERTLRARRVSVLVKEDGTESMNKIILADNQAIFRAGTAKVLTMEDDFRIIAQCGDAERLYQVLETFRGATLLFASALKLNIHQLVERVRSQGSLCIVIAENSESTSAYLSAGVHGAAHRSVSGPALIDCARRVARAYQDAVEERKPACGGEELDRALVVSGHDDLRGAQAQIERIEQGEMREEIVARARHDSL